MKEEHITVEFTESSKNNKLINCEVHGGIKIAGENNSLIRTKIIKIKKQHPLLFLLAN